MLRLLPSRVCVPTAEAEDHVKKPTQRQNSLLNINRENSGPGRRGEETKSTSHWRMCSPATDIFPLAGLGAQWELSIGPTASSGRACGNPASDRCFLMRFRGWCRPHSARFMPPLTGSGLTMSYRSVFRNLFCVVYRHSEPLWPQPRDVLLLTDIQYYQFSYFYSFTVIWE